MYDVIVVGARCAGASTGMLLARKGYRVLLVDKARFPSDMPLSTHLIWQGGAARLKRWGLLDTIWASNCPPISLFTLDLGPFALSGSPPPADGTAEACSPRRTVLDKFLVEAAVDAGAELREGTAVEELVGEDGRIAGVVLRERGGQPATERARIVVGADGTNSTVARIVGAPAYNTRPRLQGTWFTYWSGVPMGRLEFCPREGRAAYAWLTNDGLALVGVNWTAADFPRSRAETEREYLEALQLCAPGLAERVRDGRREEGWRGGSIPNFCRRPHGPGWALVGDAGITMDPCTAAGISNAFRDAELLADAIDEGLSGGRPLEEALTAYGRRRDEAMMPVYEFACELAPFRPPPPEMLQLYAALRGNQAATDRFLGVFAQTVPIPEFFAPENMHRIIGKAEQQAS